MNKIAGIIGVICIALICSYLAVHGKEDAAIVIGLFSGIAIWNILK